MGKELQTDGTVLAFATYKPKAGQEAALQAIVDEHAPVLRKLGLITDRSNFVAKSQDGTIIEVFEWASASAIGKAHEHPEVGAIWGKMGEVADFVPMNALPEGGRPFPGFEVV